MLKDIRVIKVLQEQVLKVLLVHKDLEVQEEHQVLKVLRVHKDQREQLDRLVFLLVQ